MHEIIQDTSGDAKLAITEQQPGDEFKAQPNPGLDRKVEELNKMKAHQQELVNKLYGTPKDWRRGVYTGPPYLEKLRVEQELNECEKCMVQLEREIREIAYAGLNAGRGDMVVSY